MATTVTDLTAPERRAVDQHRRQLSSERGQTVSREDALADWLENCAVAWREAWQRDYLEHQREEIMRHKWIESQKANRDLGAEAVVDWITRYAAAWREWYESQAELPRERCFSSQRSS